MNLSKLIFAISFILNFNVGFTQNLGLDDLIILQKSTFIDCNDFLSKKGWEFSNSTEGNEDSYSEVVWAFDKTYGAKAVAWLRLQTYEGFENNIYYQFHEKGIYSMIKDKINQYSMKLIESRVLDNSIYATYEGASYVVSLEIVSEVNSEHATYHAYVYNKDSYYLMKLAALIGKVEEAPKQSDKSTENNDTQNKGDAYLDLLEGELAVVKLNTNMFDSPNSNGNVIKVLVKNSSVEILDKHTRDENYWYVRWGNLKGYLDKSCFL